jgi:hypothetical protein
MHGFAPAQVDGITTIYLHESNALVTRPRSPSAASPGFQRPLGHCPRVQCAVQRRPPAIPPTETAQQQRPPTQTEQTFNMVKCSLRHTHVLGPITQRGRVGPARSLFFDGVYSLFQRHIPISDPKIHPRNFAKSLFNAEKSASTLCTGILCFSAVTRFLGYRFPTHTFPMTT